MMPSKGALAPQLARATLANVTKSKESARSGETNVSRPGLADGEKGAVLQRDLTTYAIAPHLPCGLITPNVLRHIADVAERYGCQTLKLTSAERIALIGLREDDIDAAWRDLGMEPGGMFGDRVRSVRVCPGTDYCRRGQQDSISVGRSLDSKYHGTPMPGKLKISVSGCPNQCTETATKDIGVVGSRQGWDLWVGGNGGATPRLATRIARCCSNEVVLKLVDQVIEFYRSNARSHERLHKTLTRVGLDKLTDALGLPRIAGSESSEDAASSAG
jgi:NAD(P)H-nitrite reductase large subunit